MAVHKSASLVGYAPVGDTRVLLPVKNTSFEHGLLPMSPPSGFYPTMTYSS